MKTQNWIVIAAIACLLVGTSGAAMADDITCTDNPGGTGTSSPVINGETVDGDVIVLGNCIITASVINGNIIVDNSDDPLARFVLNVSIVGGQVKVDGGSAAIIDSVVTSEKKRAILIKSVDGDTIVSGTTVQSTGAETASIVVRADLADSAKVLLYANTVSNGSIKCVDKLNIQTYAQGNTVPRGEISCFGQ